MIHTFISLNHKQFTAIAGKILAIDGVFKFEQNTRMPRLIMVSFDAAKVRALTLLNKLTRLGFNASLVGI